MSTRTVLIVLSATILIIIVGFNMAVNNSMDSSPPSGVTITEEPVQAQTTLRVSVSDRRESDQSSVRTEIWARGSGSWFPDMRFGGDVRNFGPYMLGSTAEMVFYPLGREVPEIPVNVNITPDLCPTHAHVT